LTRSGGGRYKFPAEKKNFAWNFNSTCNNNKDPKKKKKQFSSEPFSFQCFVDGETCQTKASKFIVA
jgi:hypothetical protein